MLISKNLRAPEVTIFLYFDIKSPPFSTCEQGVQRYEVMEHMVTNCFGLNFRGDPPTPLQFVPTNHFVPAKNFPYHPPSDSSYLHISLRTHKKFAYHPPLSSSYPHKTLRTRKKLRLAHIKFSCKCFLSPLKAQLFIEIQ